MGTATESRRRLARAESRQRLLDAGVDLLRERPTAAGLDHIRATDVVERLGLTSGAFYNHWESQDDYRRELLREAFNPERWPAASDVGDLAEGLVRSDEPLSSVLQVAAESAWDEGSKNEVILRLQYGLWARSDPEIDARIGEQYKAVGERWAAVMDFVLKRYGLSLRAPVTVESLSVVLAALLDGMYARFTVDAARSNPGDQYSSTKALFVDAVLLLFVGVIGASPDLSNVSTEVASRFASIRPTTPPE